MSIIQEALKRAQYNYSGKKSLPQAHEDPVQEPAIPVPAVVTDARAINKKISIIVYVIVLLSLVTGFGIRTLFSKIATTDKEIRSKDLVVAPQRTSPDKEAASPISSGAVERATGKLLALVSPGQINQPPNLVLNGIMYIEEKPKAIINGTVVREGDVISGATVTSITPDNVLLKYNNNDNKVEVALKLKE